MKRWYTCAAVAAVLAGPWAACHIASARRAAVSVEVRRGERMADFIRRLERRGLAVRRDAEEFAALQPYPDRPDIPPPARDITRFEGALRPGRYLIPAEKLRDTGHPGGRTGSLLACIIERSRRRYENGHTGGLTPYQQAILASLVEKETAGGGAYGPVASVFCNRLRDGWNLCSCPALEYALGYHRPFLTKRDLEYDSPYNLYRRKGLPPTPICFYSDAALDAAARPAASGLFFFVLDWTTGELLFSATFEGHLVNARTARARYGARHGEDRLYALHRGLYYEDPYGRRR